MIRFFMNLFLLALIGLTIIVLLAIYEGRYRQTLEEKERDNIFNQVPMRTNKNASEY